MLSSAMGMLSNSLASPATKFPDIFGNNTFLKTFPFALPNLVAGVLFTFGIAAGWLFFKESLAEKKNNRDYGRIVGNKLLNGTTIRLDGAVRLPPQ